MSKYILQSFLMFSILILGCTSEAQHASDPELAKQLNDQPVKVDPLDQSEEDWRKELSGEEFRILRESGTERAYSGDLWDNKKEGVYVCAGCGQELFSSEHKFKSGTGWPSYYQPIKKGVIGYARDGSLSMSRVEVHCGKCGGHQGHVFRDGPEPTGLRYCINGAALDFVPAQ